MKLKPLLPSLGLALVLLLPACGGEGEAGAGGARPSSLERASWPAPLFLLPAVEPVPPGQEVGLSLRAGWAPPGDPASWSGLQVDHLAVRHQGSQWVLEPGEALRVPGPGRVLVALAARCGGGPSNPKNRMYWQAKTLVAAAGPDSRPDAGITARVGHALEIVPLVDPGSLRPGADLPFRVHAPVRPVEVLAGREGMAAADWWRPAVDGAGMGVVSLGESGRWAVVARCRAVPADGAQEEEIHVAALVFTLPEAGR